MATESAGILLYRTHNGRSEVLLAHPGGPFWKNKDASAWSIPKGEVEPGESLEDAARREFREETGQDIIAALRPLPPVKLKGGKVVHAFAAAGDCEAADCHSNSVRMELPAKSGRFITFPEVDRFGWFPLDEAAIRIHPGQLPLLDHLAAALSDPSRPKP